MVSASLTDLTPDDVEFCVVDVETTGLYPTLDRVIEVAVLRFDRKRNLVDKYVSLVNPNRDLGMISKHGIRASDVRDAPQFSDIAGDVLERMTGSVLVGHNAGFDRAFVFNEFQRAGISLPELAPLLCTFKLAGNLAVPTESLRLESVCAFFGVPLEKAHAAEQDATATAELLWRLFELGRAEGFRTLQEFACIGEHCPPDGWPKGTPSRRFQLRREKGSAEVVEETYLARLVRKLHDAEAMSLKNEFDAASAAYYELLDRVLEDRRVSAEEAAALESLAQSVGIRSDRILSVHRRYLEKMVEAAMADGVVTDVERHDLETLTRLFGFPIALLDGSIAAASPKPTALVEATDRRSELRGKSVCFTGESICKLRGEPLTRDKCWDLATAAGMEIKDSVTKKLDILVVTDPDSMSGKAKKARDYGKRVIFEPTFWKMVGIDVET